MKVIVIGTRTIGSAVKRTLEAGGHDVVSVGRTSGGLQADISKRDSLTGPFQHVGPPRHFGHAARSGRGRYCAAARMPAAAARSAVPSFSAWAS